jgi:hypothetical protein
MAQPLMFMFMMMMMMSSERNKAKSLPKLLKNIKMLGPIFLT